STVPANRHSSTTAERVARTILCSCRIIAKLPVAELFALSLLSQRSSNPVYSLVLSEAGNKPKPTLVIPGELRLDLFNIRCGTQRPVEHRRISRCAITAFLIRVT